MERRPRPHLDISATCACGAVSVTIDGPIRSMFMCACEACQKATGTGHSTVAIVNTSDFRVAGPTKSFSRPAASGATFTQNFCPECGTPLYGRSSRAPDSIMLPVGLLGARTDWYKPNQLIFARSHREWDCIADDLPRHATYRNPDAV